MNTYHQIWTQLFIEKISQRGQITRPFEFDRLQLVNTEILQSEKSRQYFWIFQAIFKGLKKLRIFLWSKLFLKFRIF